MDEKSLMPNWTNSPIGLLPFLNSRAPVRGIESHCICKTAPNTSFAQLGAHKAGLIVVPCGPMFRAWELEEELIQTGTKIIVCQDELYLNVKEANQKCPIPSDHCDRF